MRLGAQLLNSSATLNDHNTVNNVTVFKGEGPYDIFFQLTDAETGQRFVPEAGSTVTVKFPRQEENFLTKPNDLLNSSNFTADLTVAKAGVNPFSLDTSIWKVTLTQIETASITSSNMIVTLTNGSASQITSIRQALVAINPAEDYNSDPTSP